MTDEKFVNQFWRKNLVSVFPLIFCYYYYYYHVWENVLPTKLERHTFFPSSPIGLSSYTNMAQIEIPTTQFFLFFFYFVRNEGRMSHFHSHVYF